MIFFGSFIGYVTVMAIAIMCGNFIAKNINEKTI